MATSEVVSAAAPADNVVVIYTDGARKGDGAGGWGAWLRYGQHQVELHGGELDTTNNRMELTAPIRALQALTRPCSVQIWTDSQYVRQGITTWIHSWKRRGWRTKDNQPVKNADLWRELEAEAARHEVAWHWVRGHTGDEGNERADQLANLGVLAARGGQQ